MDGWILKCYRYISASTLKVLQLTWMPTPTHDLILVLNAASNKLNSIHVVVLWWSLKPQSLGNKPKLCCRCPSLINLFPHLPFLFCHLDRINFHHLQVIGAVLQIVLFNKLFSQKIKMEAAGL